MFVASLCIGDTRALPNLADFVELVGVISCAPAVLTTMARCLGQRRLTDGANAHAFISNTGATNEKRQDQASNGFDDPLARMSIGAGSRLCPAALR